MTTKTPTTKNTDTLARIISNALDEVHASETAPGLEALLQEAYHVARVLDLADTCQALRQAYSRYEQEQEARERPHRMRAIALQFLDGLDVGDLVGVLMEGQNGAPSRVDTYTKTAGEVYRVTVGKGACIHWNREEVAKIITSERAHYWALGRD